MRNSRFLISLVLFFFAIGVTDAQRTSFFYPDALLSKGKKNLETSTWAQDGRAMVLGNARVWMGYSDEQLWNFMFGSTITRSWMVWSDGYCPACKKAVPMYKWEIDPLNMAFWKVRCPNCKQMFPTNDFEKYYKSGLDRYGVFQYESADRSLLFNQQHPDPNDPLRLFGVDDGEGYLQDGHRWRFIGAYLIYGQWKKVVHNGIKYLAYAYVVTGDPNYAHKAGVLLDRVADLYPSFDYMNQAFVYEKVRHNGYVSVWHDAAEETRELAMAYDIVKGAIEKDQSLASFLSEKAKKYNLKNSKATGDLVCENIENGILRDAIKNNHKIWSNYPRREVALVNIYFALGDPESIAKGMALLDKIVAQATAVDGLTGEKGLAQYSAGDIHSMALLLEQFSRRDPNFLPQIFKKHPQLAKTWKFHIDTLCLQRYYPQVGDTGYFASPSTTVGNYVGVFPNLPTVVEPSLYTFLYRLYEITGDPAYVQAIFRTNGNLAKGLPKDMFGDEELAFYKKVEDVVLKTGSLFKLDSVNKNQWHLAILRSGENADERALWMSYDSGHQHGHRNGLNLGLFAKELDLMPDFGYAPVNYGGWGSPKANWYVSSLSHNTVVVDGKNHQDANGKALLWAPGTQFHAIRSSGKDLIENGKQFERTAILADVSKSRFYVVDIFRVVGGRDHAKFFTSHFGTVFSENLKLETSDSYYDCNEMRNFMTDKHPVVPWSVNWKIEDRYNLLSGAGKRDIHVRYTDLTENASASTLECWVQAGPVTDNAPTWVPRVMVRRQDKNADLASTFVDIIEPYEDSPTISSVARITIADKSGTPSASNNVALEIKLPGGTRDIIFANDVENASGCKPAFSGENKAFLPSANMEFDGQLCLARFGSADILTHVLFSGGQYLRIGKVEVFCEKDADYVEFSLTPEKVIFESGSRAALKRVLSDSKELKIEQ